VGVKRKGPDIDPPEWLLVRERESGRIYATRVPLAFARERGRSRVVGFDRWRLKGAAVGSPFVNLLGFVRANTEQEAIGK